VTTTVSCTIPQVPAAEPAALPLAAPDDGWIGTCSDEAGNLAECLQEFQRQCPDGLLVVKVDIYSGTYNFYCLPHEDEPLAEFPIAAPADPGSAGNWVGGCYGDDVDGCLDDLKSACDADGGDYSEWYDDEGGAGVYCENQSEASGNSWEEECSWASCWMADLSCWMDGGKGYGVEDAAGNTGYHCDLPDSTDGQQAGGGVPGSLPDLGLGALIGVVAAVAIPAFMKNARKAKTAEAVTNVRK
jgi:hypothetical protein